MPGREQKQQVIAVFSLFGGYGLLQAAGIFVLYGIIFCGFGAAGWCIYGFFRHWIYKISFTMDDGGIVRRASGGTAGASFHCVKRIVIVPGRGSSGRKAGDSGGGK